MFSRKCNKKKFVFGATLGRIVVRFLSLVKRRADLGDLVDDLVSLVRLRHAVVVMQTRCKGDLLVVDLHVVDDALHGLVALFAVEEECESLEQLKITFDDALECGCLDFCNQVVVVEVLRTKVAGFKDVVHFACSRGRHKCKIKNSNEKKSVFYWVFRFFSLFFIFLLG